MKPNTPLIILSIACLFIASCKKDGGKPNGPASDIYTAGYVRASNGQGMAAYWKNGALVKLGDGPYSSVAYAVAIDGNDVYAIGSRTISNGNTVATIWKNGMAIALSADTINSSDARSITIDQHNIYAGGYINNFQAAYWKNGAVTPFAGNGVANAIAVEGHTVYAAGLIFDAKISNDEAVYWANGTAKECIVSSINDNSSASGIAVSGTDVYITGYANGGKYWKNGTEVDLSNGFLSYPLAIAVNGSDVYMAGEVDSPSGAPVSTATFWKNGAAISLTKGTSFAHANAIALDRSDVYIAGQDNGNAVYWKNGSEVQLASNGAAYGITIVPHYWQ